MDEVERDPSLLWQRLSGAERSESRRKELLQYEELTSGMQLHMI